MLGDRINDLNPAMIISRCTISGLLACKNDPDYTWQNGKRGGQFHMGEDYGFSLKARQLGFQIYADTSVVVEHIGRAILPTAPPAKQLAGEKSKSQPGQPALGKQSAAGSSGQ